MKFRLACLAGVLIFLQSAAWATFHEMQIELLIGGVDGDTTAQAIQLRLREFGNNFVFGTKLRVWDATGANPITIATFTGNVTNDAQGARILVCSPAFANHVSGTLTPDFYFDAGAAIPVSYFNGGKITYEGTSGIVWSVAFGTYTGTNLGTLDNDVDGNFNPPFAGALPSANRKALQFQGNQTAMSTQNSTDYALTVGDATFMNNAGTGFTLANHHPVASNDGPKCEGTQLQIFVAALVNGATNSDYVWTAPDASNFVGPVVTIPNAATTHAGTWTVVVTVSGSPLPSSSTTVVVNATPSTTASANATTLCVGSQLDLFATSVSGGTYSWTGPGGFTSTMQNPSISGIQTNHAGTYTVRVTKNTCISAPSNVVITVNSIPAKPTATSNANPNICEGQTLNLMTPTVSGATYSWTGPMSFTSNAQNPSITNAASGRSGTYSVTVTVNGCTSTAGTVEVVVTPTATFTASSNSAVCEGGTLNLSVTPSADSYLWSGPNGFVSTMQNPSVTNVTPGMAGMYSVVATVSGCPMPAANTTVVVTARPSTPVASNNGPVIEGGSLQLSASTIVNATYSWTGPNGYTSNVQNPLISNVGVSHVGDFSVIATVNGCPSLTATTTPQITLQAPAFSGTPGATPNPAIVATAVQFSAAATGVGPFTFSWDFGDGLSGTGSSVSHSFSPSGGYTVTVTVKDSRNLTTSTTIDVAADPALVGGGGSAPGEIDSDGDGFTDAQETAFGSSTTNQSSTPFGVAPAGTPEILTLSKMSIKLNFAKPLSDAISASGVLPVTAGFSVGGKQIVADVGGVVRVFTLSAKGASASGSADAFKISIKASKGVVAEQLSKWSLKMSKGSYATALAGEGLTADSDAKDKAVSVPVTLLFNQKYFTTQRSQLYSAKAGKTGKTKDAK